MTDGSRHVSAGSRPRWSHLTIGPDDDLEELRAFAHRIGLRRSWFQDKPWPQGHYDVMDSKRRQANRLRRSTVPGAAESGPVARPAFRPYATFPDRLYSVKAISISDVWAVGLAPARR